MLLPMENCDSGALQDMYINLVREFGTHYTTEVVMGAKAVQQLTFSKSDLSKLESEGISAKVMTQFKYIHLKFYPFVIYYHMKIKKKLYAVIATLYYFFDVVNTYLQYTFNERYCLFEIFKRLFMPQ